MQTATAATGFTNPADAHPTSVSPLVFDRTGLSNAELLDLYRSILLPRLIEEKMLILLRQNKISKWFSGIGQEAISVGITKALTPNDYVYPLHRNLGVFTCRGMDFRQLFTQWQGGTHGFTKGRDRSFHFGSPQHRVIGMISHLGAMLGVAGGTSLASNLQQNDFISVAFSGDGGASEGDFHEAINVAAVWDLPVIFVIENNGYGLSTPSNEQFRCKQFIDKAIGYGIEGVQVDGNDVLAVYGAVKKIAAQMRINRKPVILECMTFRMRGHEEASGTKYVPKELMDAWAVKDPVTNYEAFLLRNGILTQAAVQEQRQHVKAYIEDGLARSFAEAPLVPNLETEMADVYAPVAYPIVQPDSQPAQEWRFIDGISDGLRTAMRRHPNLVLMGQDIAEYGGVFKITQGFVEEFGKARVRNTPLCESAILANALGLTLQGYRAMVEMQFADFVSCGFNQIVNNLAKTHYRWAHPVPVVVRMPTGAGVAAGPFHSQSNEAWFAHIAGLKIVYPSNPYDAKGLLLSAFEENNPVIYFEHKVLYRSVSGPVPQGYYNVPIGVAAVAQPGTDATIVTYGAGVHWALAAAKEMHGYSVEVIDLRSLLPWDKETVYNSIRKTGKVLVLHEDTLTGGIGGEIAACIGEEMFQQLDAPVMRLGSLDTPVPFNADLEKQFLPTARLKQKLAQLLEY
jgi:2-oxoisovalerate dehydrogenase E1 component